MTMTRDDRIKRAIYALASAQVGAATALDTIADMPDYAQTVASLDVAVFALRQARRALTDTVLNPKGN